MMLAVLLHPRRDPLQHASSAIHESEADAFGLDVGARARRLRHDRDAAERISQDRAGALEEMLFFDHPSGRTRVSMAMDWKAKHLAELPADQQRQMVMTPDKPAK